LSFIDEGIDQVAQHGIRQRLPEFDRAEGGTSRTYCPVGFDKKRTAGFSLTRCLIERRNHAEWLLALLTKMVRVIKEKAGLKKRGNDCLGRVMLPENDIIPHGEKGLYAFLFHQLCIHQLNDAVFQA